LSSFADNAIVQHHHVKGVVFFMLPENIIINT